MASLRVAVSVVRVCGVVPVSVVVRGAERCVALSWFLVRSRLGFEARVFDGDSDSEVVQHGIQHVVVQIAQAAGLYHERHVPVTQMVRHSREEQRVRVAYDGNALPGRQDADTCAILGGDDVTVARPRAARALHQHGPSSRELHAKAASLTGVERERDGFSYRCVA
jgi:hypothetical protein